MGCRSGKVCRARFWAPGCQVGEVGPGLRAATSFGRLLSGRDALGARPMSLHLAGGLEREGDRETVWDWLREGH